MDLRSCMQVGHIQIFQIPTFPMIGRAPQVVSRKGTLQYIIIQMHESSKEFNNQKKSRNQGMQGNPIMGFAEISHFIEECIKKGILSPDKRDSSLPGLLNGRYWFFMQILF